MISRLAPGPRVRFGAMRFEGLKSVQANYLRAYTPQQEHALYSRSAVEKFQTSLFLTSLFESVSVQPTSLAETVALAAKKVPLGDRGQAPQCRCWRALLYQ